jgi:hypothetical protein
MNPTLHKRVFVTAAKRIDERNNSYACHAINEAAGVHNKFREAQCYTKYFMQCMDGAKPIVISCWGGSTHGIFDNPRVPLHQEQRILALLFTALMLNDGVTF